MRIWVLILIAMGWQIQGMARWSINYSEYDAIPSRPAKLEAAFKGRKALKEAVSISFIERAIKTAKPEWRLFPDRNSDPENLIAYIYYINLQPGCPELWDEMVNWKIPHLLSAQVQGYSVYGAAVIAEDLSRDKKKQVIKNLRMLGFKPNKKDYDLAELEQFEEEEQEPLLLSEWIK